MKSFFLAVLGTALISYGCAKRSEDENVPTVTQLNASTERVPIARAAAPFQVGHYVGTVVTDTNFYSGREGPFPHGLIIAELSGGGETISSEDGTVLYTIVPTTTDQYQISRNPRESGTLDCSKVHAACRFEIPLEMGTQVGLFHVQRSVIGDNSEAFYFYGSQVTNHNGYTSTSQYDLKLQTN